MFVVAESILWEKILLNKFWCKLKVTYILFGIIFQLALARNKKKVSGPCPKIKSNVQPSKPLVLYKLFQTRLDKLGWWCETASSTEEVQNQF